MVIQHQLPIDEKIDVLFGGDSVHLEQSFNAWKAKYPLRRIIETQFSITSHTNDYIRLYLVVRSEATNGRTT